MGYYGMWDPNPMGYDGMLGTPTLWAIMGRWDPNPMGYYGMWDPHVTSEL